MQNMATPEFVSAQIDLALINHEARVSQDHVEAVQAAAVALAVGPRTLGGASTADALASVELAANIYKETHRTSARLTALLPCWALSVFRADLSRRAGVESFNVSDAQITAWFSARGIDLEFAVIDTATLVGAVDYPATIPMYLYADGSVLALDSGSLTFDVVRDSVLNAKNQFSFFTEEFYTTCIRGVVTSVEIPVCTAGITGENSVACA